MRLEIDAGNTLIKWRLVDVEENIVARGAADQHANSLRQLVDREYIGRISHVLISSVSGSELVETILSSVVPDLEPANIFVARAAPSMAGVEFSYEDVSRLGIDRCLAMISAYRQFTGGVMVIDCGSAITADVVSAEGIHLGGYILPGIRLLTQSLMTGTANVIVEPADHDRLTIARSSGLGRSTEACVGNGIRLMIHSTMLALKSLALDRGVPYIVMTGGDGELIGSMDGLGFCYQKDLVLDGLRILNPF